MHPDETEIDGALVSRLVAKQFPQWADLPITKVRSAGTDTAMYRLGDTMAVRLPRLPRAAKAVDTEQRWLPRLAPLLPLAIPVPLGKGVPDESFPFPWSVCRWLDGDNLADTPDVDLHDAAAQLGRFVAALQRIDTTGGPPSFRGGPVGALDDRVRAEIRDLGADGTVDLDLATAAWQTALTAPVWDGTPVWVHADLYPVNLLARQGRLTAVIDFGGLGVGDPAIDMLPAWALLTARTRDLFHAERPTSTMPLGRAGAAGGWAWGSAPCTSTGSPTRCWPRSADMRLPKSSPTTSAPADARGGALRRWANWSNPYRSGANGCGTGTADRGMATPARPCHAGCQILPDASAVAAGWLIRRHRAGDRVEDGACPTAGNCLQARTSRRGRALSSYGVATTNHRWISTSRRLAA